MTPSAEFAKLETDLQMTKKDLLSLKHPFRHADQQDWDTLFEMISTFRGKDCSVNRFWTEVLTNFQQALKETDIDG